MARLTERTALWSALGAGLAQLQSILLFLWCAHRLSGPDLGSFRLVGLLVLLLALLGAAGAPEALLHGL
ncbi:MAG: hypothetical protein FJX77_16085, partial [Armatimonadetes bacterium]|nr:hypothetical protein [Armatimonadota bacterium]